MNNTEFNLFKEANLNTLWEEYDNQIDHGRVASPYYYNESNVFAPLTREIMNELRGFR